MRIVIYRLSLSFTYKFQILLDKVTLDEEIFFLMDIDCTECHHFEFGLKKVIGLYNFHESNKMKFESDILVGANIQHVACM